MLPPILKSLSLLLLICLACRPIAQAADLHVGAATVDITPSQPVALDGQRNVRIASDAVTPISATALAIESREGEHGLDCAVIVSCDLVAIRKGILDKVRERVRPRLPGFDLSKLFLCATHTHTAPATVDGRYVLPESGIMQPSAYADWMVDKVADAVVQAWQSRKPGRVGWGQSQAVLAQNRRATYADGTAQMYGKTDTETFRGIEGYEDHDVDVLFFWDMDDRLLATAINVPCPAQEVGSGRNIHADFWYPVRLMLREKFGKELHVIGWTGAAGDQVSTLMYGKAADARMRKLRGKVSRIEELARRLVRAWDDAYDAARQEKHSTPVLQHTVRSIELPWRQVTDEELEQATVEAAKYAQDPAQHWNFRWNQAVVERYAAQKAGTQGMYQMELHALRLGDVAIGTNDFELFTDFGIQMKGRSPALQTFVIQLAGPGSYLPTERAVRGGGYSAVIQSSQVGPDAGQVLVNETVRAWRELWPEAREERAN